MSLLGITLGCPAGIGPEIIIKYFATRSPAAPRAVVLGDQSVLQRCAAEMGVALSFSPWQPADPLPVANATVPVLSLSALGTTVRWGKPDRQTAVAMVDYITRAVQLIDTGVLSGLAKMAWKSADDQIARMDGPALTAGKLGKTAVTAQLGSVASAPAEVEVVESIVDELAIDSKRMQMFVGESRAVGRDVVISRGMLDVSNQCDVNCSPATVVSYNPATHSLVGRSPGVADVTFAFGNKIIHSAVEAE